MGSVDFDVYCMLHSFCLVILLDLFLFSSTEAELGCQWYTHTKSKAAGSP